MYINIPHEGEQNNWQRFDITPQDFHRDKRDRESLIIDSPTINAAFEPFKYLINGKLHLHLDWKWYSIRWRYWGPADSPNDWVRLPGAADGLQWMDCFCTDEELQMLTRLLYPHMAKDPAAVLDFVSVVRRGEFQDRDGKLYPYIEIPQPYKDELYRDFSEPYAKISF